MKVPFFFHLADGCPFVFHSVVHFDTSQRLILETAKDNDVLIVACGNC